MERPAGHFDQRRVCVRSLSVPVRGAGGGGDYVLGRLRAGETTCHVNGKVTVSGVPGARC